MVLGGGPHRPEPPSTAGITLFLVPLDHPGITVNAIWTMGDERTNEVHLDDVWVSDDYVVGELNHGFQYISEALDLERFTMFTFSPIAQRLEPAVRVRGGRHPRRAAAEGRPGGAATASPSSPPRPRWPGCSGCVRHRIDQRAGPRPPRGVGVQALRHRVLARLADASMDIAGPGRQLRVKTDEAPMEGRAESTYRYTVIDTIGGGTSEIQKNIIARRKLGLPKNF